MRSLGLRISLIMGTAIAVLVLTIMIALYVERGDGARAGFRMPVPDQVAATVELLEETPLEDQSRLLRAINSVALRVWVEDYPPPPDRKAVFPALSWVVERYFAALNGRSVTATFRDLHDAEPRLLDPGTDLRVSHPLRLVVELKEGRFAVFEVHGEIQNRLTGLRLASLILAMSIVISAITFWALRRQIKPLEALAESVERLGTADETPIAMTASGAEEVHQLTRATGDMQARIRNLLESRTRMMAAIGHDLATYLTRLRLRAEFITDEAQRERAARDIEDMRALMADTLTLAQTDEDREAVERRNLVTLARHYAEGFSSSGQRVRFHTMLDRLEADVRPVAVGRAITNLIGNALKYGEEADVTLSRVGNEAVIEVEDRGPGIPSGERAAVLEPYYRRDPARNLDKGGSGLGLAIVADVVRRHGGRISLEDRDGGGLTVRVTLPLPPAAPHPNS